MKVENKKISKNIPTVALQNKMKENFKNEENSCCFGYLFNFYLSFFFIVDLQKITDKLLNV